MPECQYKTNPKNCIIYVNSILTYGSVSSGIVVQFESELVVQYVPE
jgi:hypothetical protein